MNKKLKRVLIEPLWKLRGEYRSWCDTPIDGYEFVIQESHSESAIKKIARWDWSYHIQHRLDKIVPTSLIKPWFERGKRLGGADLVYAVLHCVFRDEPWILDMKTEQPHLLAGSERVFRRYKDKIAKMLQSDNCRAIVCDLEAERQAMLQYFPKAENKLRVIHSTVPKRQFTKVYDDRKIKLLFVNSANISASYHFCTHGGLILLDTFEMLQKNYGNLQLVIRSGVSKAIKKRVRGNLGIRLYDEVIPWEVLEHEFKTADIFVYPTHVTPSTVFLDAMSYELPIVSTRLWGNSEIIKGGATGLLVRHPKADEFMDGFIVHFDSKEYKQVIEGNDYLLSEAVAEKVAQLVDDSSLRRLMGEAGRYEIEHGEFSSKRWIKSITEVLNEATELSR